jgi:DNA polymerase
MTVDFQSEAIRFLRQVGEGESEIVLDFAEESVTQSPEPSSAIDEADPKRIELNALARTAAVCTLCELSRSRNKVVFGVGNPHARLMFVGEAPGADEDRLGEPFVGRAGQLLTKIIGAMNLTRQDVYIANILKCRPPGNRNPLPHEAHLCTPYLLRQIEIIQPGVIVALGLVAATRLLDLPPTTAVRDLRGRVLEFHGRPLIVTYHPAALLRNPGLKAPTWQDMQKVMGMLGR